MKRILFAFVLIGAGCASSRRAAADRAAAEREAAEDLSRLSAELAVYKADSAFVRGELRKLRSASVSKSAAEALAWKAWTDGLYAGRRGVHCELAVPWPLAPATDPALK